MAAELGGALLRGAGIGVAIAAPVGPIALLCIRRTLTQGPAAGIASGLGAATADAVYGVVAALGLGAAAALLLDQAAALQVAGGLLLAWLGLGALRRAMVPRPPAGGEAGPGRLAGPVAGLAAAFGSTFALTLANPMTVLSFAAVVAALAGPGGGATAGLALVAGVFLGSLAWWVLLVGGVTALRRALPPGALRVIEGISGAVLLGFGIAALASGLRAGG